MDEQREQIMAIIRQAGLTAEDVVWWEELVNQAEEASLVLMSQGIRGSSPDDVKFYTANLRKQEKALIDRDEDKLNEALREEREYLEPRIREQIRKKNNLLFKRVKEKINGKT